MLTFTLACPFRCLLFVAGLGFNALVSHQTVVCEAVDDFELLKGNADDCAEMKNPTSSYLAALTTMTTTIGCIRPS